MRPPPRRADRLTAATAAGWRVCWLAVGLAGFVGGCELHHPFEADRPPPGLLAVRDSVPVAVAPIEGEPAEAAGELGAAIAKALRQRDIAASDRSASPAGNTLRGSIERVPTGAGKAALQADWRLYDAAGKLLGERSERVEAAADAWEKGDGAAIGRLAEASADKLTGLMQDEPAKPPGAPPAAQPGAAPGPANAAPDTGNRIRVLVRKINGAPGDGGQALARAIAAVLQRQEVDIVEDGKGKPDLVLECEVAIAAQKGADKQHVKIVWHVRRPDGAEIGTVGQENDVPKGLLDGPWGDIAYSVALAAGDGIAQLVARGAPERKGTS